MSWGLSPQTNLLSGKQHQSNEVNILLLCPGDPRSILKTLADAVIERGSLDDGADSYSQSQHLRFHIVEEHTEILARHFLLLHTFFDESVPIKQRSVMYLEIFGNSMITDKASAYVEEKGKSLVELVLDEKEQLGLEGIFDLSLLKQREKDDLASVFESFGAPSHCDLMEERSYILRSYYGDRYDSRSAVIDWDYHTQVKPFASIIHPTQFRDWRLEGQAFEFGGSSYNSTNQTVPIPTKSRTHLKMDVTTGPFISYGIDCDRTDPFADALFEVHNKGTGAAQHRYSSTDVSLYNIARFMWEISTREEYRMQTKGDVLSGIGGECIEKIDTDNVQEETDPPGRVSFSIVPIKDCRTLFRKQRFKGLFHSVFVSHDASSIVKDLNFYELMKSGASMTVETCSLQVVTNKSHKQESTKRLREMLGGANMTETTVVRNADCNESLLMFRIN